MVGEFSTAYAISAYHLHCEFESRSWQVYSLQHYVIKLAIALMQVGVFLWVIRFPPLIKLTDTI
jgi:hypothetical protein